MPYFICPNCKDRSIDHDRREGLTQQAVACHRCGFGFLFELLEDYYPAPSTGFLVCDNDARVLACGRDILIGLDVIEARGIRGFEGDSPAKVSIEWGVRRLDQQLEMRSRAGTVKPVTGDFFPAYDDDGGLLVGLTPR